MNEVDIKEFLSRRSYDIRKTNNGRWIDQKCTMDVVCLVSDCIVEYVKQFPNKEFTVNDIPVAPFSLWDKGLIFPSFE